MTRSLVFERIGYGLAWPLRPEDGRLPRAEGLARIQQALRMILETAPGERLMRPDFGCDLRRFLQQPNSGATRVQIESAVREALGRWEPRITLIDVVVEPDAQTPSAVWVLVDYRLKLDGQRDSLVFPFHLE
jgi:phage baseplate assembly protein W